jgi:hypothetical protein
MKKEIYTNDSTEFQGRTIKFYSAYSSMGVHIEIYEDMGDEEKELLKKHLRGERDVVSLRFIK